MDTVLCAGTVVAPTIIDSHAGVPGYYALKSDIVSQNRIVHDLELTVPTVTGALKDLQALGLAGEDGILDKLAELVPGANEALKSFYGYGCPEDIGIFSTDLTDETIASMQDNEFNKVCVAIIGNFYVCLTCGMARFPYGPCHLCRIVKW